MVLSRNVLRKATSSFFGFLVNIYTKNNPHFEKEKNLNRTSEIETSKAHSIKNASDLLNRLDRKTE